MKIAEKSAEKHVKHFLKLTLFTIALSLPVTGASAKGDLAVKAKMLKLELGSEKSDYAMSSKEFQLETGQAYRLKIISSGLKEYSFEAPEFFANIWVRKLEVEDVEIKAPVIEELSFEEYEESEAELFFVPIRTGVYEFSFEGLEERGMVGKFIVK
jgi:hypothetical protein|tara:strand:- start:739 stop:1206 length:468 start_codon:yes stop_codon:yes gene_type:complete